MPGFNGTGPMGYGPMTGGGRGYCNPNWSAGLGSSRGFGRGRGFRRGFGAGPGWGRGYGRGFAPRGVSPAWGGWQAPNYGPAYGMSPEEELNMLKNDAEAMRSELDAVNRRIQDLEARPAEA